MSFSSCKVEISNSTRSSLLDPEMFLPSGQCSVPLSPVVRSCSDGGATFTSPAGKDLGGMFTYNLVDQRHMLAVFFHVPPAGKGSNDFAVAIMDPTTCNQDLYKHMTEGSEKGPLRATKGLFCGSSLVVRATMSDTANAVLKVDVSNFSC